jgi:hypothetical protein
MALRMMLDVLKMEQRRPLGVSVLHREVKVQV